MSDLSKKFNKASKGKATKKSLDKPEPDLKPKSSIGPKPPSLSKVSPSVPKPQSLAKQSDKKITLSDRNQIKEEFNSKSKKK